MKRSLAESIIVEPISERERAVFYTTRFGKRQEHPMLHPARPRQAEARHFEAMENRLDKALITKALGLQMLTKGKLFFLFLALTLFFLLWQKYFLSTMALLLLFAINRNHKKCNVEYFCHLT